jgi:hypothetical protein
MSRNLKSSLGRGLDKGGQGPTSGCRAIIEEEEEEEEYFKGNK